MIHGHSRDREALEQRSLFGLSERLEKLSKHGDSLEALETTVDFEHFRGWLVEGLAMARAARGADRRSIPFRCSRR